MAINPITGVNEPDRIQRGTVAGPQEPQRSTGEEFRRALFRGTQEVGSLTQEAVAAGQAALGFEEAAQQRLQAAEERREVAQRVAAPRIGRVEDIGSSGDFVADTVDFLAQLAGSQLPILGTLAATGGAGGVAGRAAAGALARRGATGAVAGGVAGVGGGSAALETGSIFGGIARDPEAEGTLQEQALLSGAGGAVAGSLDALPIFRAVRRLGVSDPLQRSLVARAAREAVPQAGTEALTEAAQTLVERGTHRFANRNFELLGPEGTSELLNAAVAGGILGGGLGAITGALQRPGPTDEDLIGEIEGEEATNRLLLERRVEQMRGHVSDDILDRFLAEPVVDDQLLDDLDAHAPSEVLDARDLSREQGLRQLAETDPLGALSVIFASDNPSRRETALGLEIAREGLRSDLAPAIENFLRERNPQLANELLDDLDTNELEGADPRLFEELGLPPSGRRQTISGVDDVFRNIREFEQELGSGIFDPDEGFVANRSTGGVNEVDTGFRDQILSTSTGTFFATPASITRNRALQGRSAEDVGAIGTIDQQLTALQELDPTSTFEPVPARLVVQLEADRRFGSDQSIRQDQAAFRLERAAIQDSAQRARELGNETQAQEIEQLDQFLDSLRSPERRRRARAAAARLVEEGQQERSQRLTRFVDLAERAFGKQNFLEEQAQRHARIRKVPLDPDNPLSVFDDEFAIQRTQARREATGGDTFALTEESLGVSIPRSVRQDFAARRQRIKESTRLTDDQKSVRLRELKQEEESQRNQQRFIRPAPVGSQPNERQLRIAINGRERFLNVPQLVKNMVRRARIDTDPTVEFQSQSFDQLNPSLSEVVTGFALALAAVQSVPRQLPVFDPVRFGELDARNEQERAELEALETARLRADAATFELRTDPDLSSAQQRTLKSQQLSTKDQRRLDVLRDHREEFERMQMARTRRDLLEREAPLTPEEQDTLDSIEFVDVVIPDLTTLDQDLVILTSADGTPLITLGEALPSTSRHQQFRAFMEAIRRRTQENLRTRGEVGTNEARFLQKALDEGLPLGPTREFDAAIAEIQKVPERDRTPEQKAELRRLKNERSKQFRPLTEDERDFFQRRLEAAKGLGGITPDEVAPGILRRMSDREAAFGDGSAADTSSVVGAIRADELVQEEGGVAQIQSALTTPNEEFARARREGLSESRRAALEEVRAELRQLREQRSQTGTPSFDEQIGRLEQRERSLLDRSVPVLEDITGDEFGFRSGFGSLGRLDPTDLRAIEDLTGQPILRGGDSLFDASSQSSGSPDDVFEGAFSGTRQFDTPRASDARDRAIAREELRNLREGARDPSQAQTIDEAIELTRTSRKPQQARPAIPAPRTVDAGPFDPGRSGRVRQRQEQEARERRQTQEQAAQEQADRIFDRLERADLTQIETEFAQTRARGRQWNRRLQIKGLRVLNTTNAVRILQQRGDVARLEAIADGTLLGFTVGESVWVSPFIDQNAQFEVLAHEMGHALAHSTAPANDQQVFDAWSQWRAETKQRNTPAEARRMMRFAFDQLGTTVPASMSNLDSTNLNYVLDFHEWFADEVAGWLVQDARPQGSVQRWFNRFANKLSTLFGEAQENLSENAVGEFLERTILNDGYAAGLVRWHGIQDARAPAAAVVSDPTTQFAHQAVLEMLRTEWLAGPPAAALGRVFAVNSSMNRRVQNLLRRHDRVAAAQVGQDWQVAAAYGFQLWADGQLELGPQAQTAYERLKDNIFRALGDTSDIEQMQQLAPQIQANIEFFQQRDPNPQAISGVINAARKNGQQSSFAVTQTVADTRLQRMGKASRDLWNQYLSPFMERIFLPAVERMERTGNAALIQLARRFHTPPGTQGAEESYLQARSALTGVWQDRVARALGDLTPEKAEAVRRAMLFGGPMEADVAVSVRRLRAAFDEMFDYANRAGVENLNRGGGGTVFRRREGYFPWVYDVDQLGARKQEFIDFLLRPEYEADMQAWLDRLQSEGPNQQITWAQIYGVSDLATLAEHIHNQISDYDGFADTGRINVNKTGHTPFMSAVNTRGLNFLQAKATGDGLEILDSFFQKDMNQILRTYTEQLVKRAEFTKRFRVHGDGSTELDDLMAQARQLGASDRELQMARDFVDAMQGTLGTRTNALVTRLVGGQAPSNQVINPKLQDTFSAVILWQNMRVLALATFTSLADPMGIAVRGGGLRSVWDGFTSAFSGRQLVSDAAEQGYTAKEVAQALGIISTYTIDQALASTYGTNFMTGRTRLWNERFFNAIMLSKLTEVSRVMATGAAINFLGRHAHNPTRHSERWLDELNLRAEDVVLGADDQVKLLTRAETDQLYEVMDQLDAARNEATERAQAEFPVSDDLELAELEPRINQRAVEIEQELGVPELVQQAERARAEIDRDQRVRAAIRRFVDESILRPNAATRPIWGSDPHFQLVFHLKSFMFTFHSQILRRVFNEVTEGRFLAAPATLMLFIPVMIVADMARDWLRFGEEGDPQKKNWGILDWSLHGMERSGIPGLGLLLTDARQDRQWGGTGLESFLGPTASSIGDVGTILTGDDEQRWQAVLDQLPGQNIAAQRATYDSVLSATGGLVSAFAPPEATQ